MAPNRRTALFLLALAGASALSLSPYRIGIVWGDSMAPALRSGALYLLVRSRGVCRGDVVVFRHAGETYVKRVIAAAGDTLYLLEHSGSSAGQLVRADQLRLLARATTRRPWKSTMKLRVCRVPEGSCFAVGDNLDRSIDSRHFGPVRLGAIVGRVVGVPPAVLDTQRLAGIFRPQPRS